MSDDGELVLSSQNPFRGLAQPNAEIQNTKAIIAAEIIKVLDACQWSTRRAEQETGVNHSDFARIRRANVGRYSLERLVSILGLLGQQVELSVHVRPRKSRLSSISVHP